MKKSYFIILTGFVFSLPKLNAQDIHFSQYFSTPLTISPSNTGNYYGDWRAMANYRTQWKEIAKPYTTESVGGDKNFYLKNNDKFSAGLLIINDNSGGNLQVTQFQLSLAYHKILGKNKFHFGIQPGYTLKSNVNKETYPNQFDWNQGQFNSSLANNELNSLNNYRLSYLDINLGVGYDRKFTDKFEIFLSYAMFHLNSPKESFLGSSNTLNMRNVGSFGFSWYLSPKITLQPSLCIMGTDKASEFLFGARAFYSLEKDYSISKSLFFGAYGRQGFTNLTDALFAVIGINYQKYYAGVSYDFNISQLNTVSNYRGAFELSFIYTGVNTHLSRTQIPCDRY